MSAKLLSLGLLAVLSLAVPTAWAADPPPAGEPSQLPISAGAPQRPAAKPTAEVPPPPVESPSPTVLNEISRRQMELALLEMELRKAELTRKLHELTADLVSAPEPTAAGPAPAPAPAPVAMPQMMLDPTVTRIHRKDGKMAATLRLPNGQTTQVAAGTTLPSGLSVVDVRDDSVLVRRGRETPYALGLNAIASVPAPVPLR